MRRSIAVLALLLAATGAAAQDPAPVEFTLQVTDSVSGRPISGARVTVAGLRWVTLTSRAGVATLRVPPGGRLLEVTRLGYAPRRLAVDFPPGTIVERSLQLSPEPVRVSGVTVTGRRRLPSLERNGFYRRERAGFGAFMTQERIDQLRPYRTLDLFRHMRGFAVTVDGRGNQILVTTRGSGSLRGGPCRPTLYLDGFSVAAMADDSDSFLNVVNPQDIAAVEGFAGAAGIPAEYNATGSACGAVLIWTRSGSEWS